MNILEEIIEYKKEEVKSKKSKVRTADLEKRELFSRTVLSLKDFYLINQEQGSLLNLKEDHHQKEL